MYSEAGKICSTSFCIASSVLFSTIGFGFDFGFDFGLDSGLLLLLLPLLDCNFGDFDFDADDALPFLYDCDIVGDDNDMAMGDDDDDDDEYSYGVVMVIVVFGLGFGFCATRGDRNGDGTCTGSSDGAAGVFVPV